MKNIDLYIDFQTSAYLGQLGQLSEIFVKKNIINGDEKLWIPYDKIPDGSKDLPFYSDFGSVPYHLFEGGILSYSFDFEESLPRQGLFESNLTQEMFASGFGDFPKPRGKWTAIYTAQDININNQ